MGLTVMGQSAKGVKEGPYKGWYPWPGKPGTKSMNESGNHGLRSQGAQEGPSIKPWGDRHRNETYKPGKEP